MADRIEYRLTTDIMFRGTVVRAGGRFVVEQDQAGTLSGPLSWYDNGVLMDGFMIIRHEELSMLIEIGAMELAPVMPNHLSFSLHTT